MGLKFLLSQKGKPLLHVDGQLYSKLRVNADSIKWRCTQWKDKDKSCHLYIKTTSDERSGKNFFSSLLTFCNIIYNGNDNY